MRDLYIVGAGGLGREVLGWALDVPEEQRDWVFKGFLDDNPDALQSYNVEWGILGRPLDFEPGEGHLFLIAIGKPVVKLNLYRRMKAKGARFLTLVHPRAIVGRGCAVGEGSVLCPGAILSADVTLGEMVSLSSYATAGHDSVIGPGCTLAAHCDVTGHVRLGEGVFMGTHAVVAPSVSVGDYAVIGAGSVVIRRVGPRETMVGVPARCLGQFCGS
jgi:sugar O-acyltransferase (sialic acid O-acetyltransferase NeuD family)